MRMQLLALGAVSLFAAVAYADPEIVAGQYGPLPQASTAANALTAQDIEKVIGRKAVQRYYAMMGREAAATPLASGGVVNFDDSAEPCTFLETTALRGVRQGAVFSGPGANGGGVLDQCSNFGIDAFSVPNFLAFNAGSPFSDGGVASLPQAVFFPGGASGVSLQVSEGEVADSAQVIVAAIGAGAVQDFQVVTLDGTWQEVTVGGPVDVLVVAGGERVLLIDDIAVQ